MNTLRKTQQQEGCTQFELTKITLNNLSQYDITPTAKLVLLYLTDCYNPNHVDVFPKQKTIADKLGISERSVMRAVQELFKAGLILIECKHTNRYILMPNMTPQLSHFDKLSSSKRQNDTFTPDNLSHTCKEQIKETKKEQTVFNKGGNVYSEDAILYDYASKHGARNINAYVNALKQTKSAENVIKEYKKKNISYPYSVKQTEILRKMREISRTERTAPESCDDWVNFAKNHGIKK